MGLKNFLSLFFASLHCRNILQRTSIISIIKENNEVGCFFFFKEKKREKERMKNPIESGIVPDWVLGQDSDSAAQGWTGPPSAGVCE